jgi:hypothetical protein
MIDAGNVKQFRIDISKALDEIGAKYGVELQLGNIRYNEFAGSSKIEWKALDKSGEKIIDPYVDFKARQWMAICGVTLPNKVIGSEFEMRDGRRFKAVDWNSRSAMYPLVGLRDGKKYKVNPREISTWL